jgi:hypothetical protein
LSAATAAAVSPSGWLEVRGRRIVPHRADRLRRFVILRQRDALRRQIAPEDGIMLIARIPAGR